MKKWIKKKVKTSKFKIWNGRGFRCRKTGKEYEHLFVCATSVKHVLKLCKQVGYDSISTCEVLKYWSKDCWGNPMEGITPEIGVWANIRHEPVIRLI